MVDNRHNPRKPLASLIEVIDTMTKLPLGRVCNLSADGMLLMGPRTLPSNALYQVSFNLPGVQGAVARPIEIGICEQWGERANAAGQFWTGFYIVDISPEDAQRLAHWVTSN